MTLIDRLLGRPQPRKAVTGPGVAAYNNSPLLSSLLNSPEQRIAAFLRAYKCGWFNKAGRKISTDVASLHWTLSEGDMESDTTETVLKRPDLDIPFEALSPVDQLQRLLERPNPNQTGKQLLAKTQIRRDFAGTAMWYLEGADSGLPSAIYGISPARMTPSRDRGGNLLGWVMDYNSPNPVPFDASEILNMPMASPDDGDGELYGVGVVEAVYSELPLSDLMARHTTDLLTTGGRLAGMLWPKERSLSEDEFTDVQRSWRNVASDPNAARRLLIFPEPMEWSTGASTPAQIGIPELANLNREQILSAFPISPLLLRIPMPSGLNASGSTRQEEEKAYWADLESLRVEPLKDYIQSGLVSIYESFLGTTLDFDMPIPNLDDAPSLIEKVGAYKGLVSVGFDPKDAVDAVGLDHIKWLGLPAIMDPAQQLQMQQAAQQAQAEQAAGVTSSASDTNHRDNATTTVAVAKAAKPVGKAELEQFFADQRDRVAENIRSTFPKSKAARKADPGNWWDAAAEDAALTDTLRGLYLKVGRDGLQKVADQLERIVANKNVRRILDDLLSYGGARISDINETTRQAIAGQLAEGTRRGYSINQIIDGVAGEGYAGVKSALLDNGVPAFGDYRAELISRTETTLSYNRASLTGYNEFGVAKVQAIDGDDDAECASRDGHIFDVDEALGIEDHPNGTLDWAPVIDKAAHLPVYKDSDVQTKVDRDTYYQIEPHINVSFPELKVVNEMPTPVVNVTTPDVTVNTPEPVVNITTPEPVINISQPDVHVTNEVKTPTVTVTNDVASPTVNVTNEVQTPTVNVKAPIVKVSADMPEPVITVNMPDSFAISSMPDRVTQRQVKRDQRGAITETTDVETDA